MNREKLFAILDDEELAAFAKYEQGRANDLQSRGLLAQRDADAARKEIKRRKGGVSNGL